MKTYQRLAFLIFLVSLLSSFNIQAQESVENFELRTEKVIGGCVEKGLCGDELNVGMESAKASALVLRAWQMKDARVFLGNEPSALRDDVQRRMAMTKSIDYLRIEIEVVAVKGNEATVLAKQQFSRVLNLSDGKERRRISGVTHKETWERADKGWKLKGFTEQDQTAWWEDEKPAKPPQN